VGAGATKTHQAFTISTAHPPDTAPAAESWPAATIHIDTDNVDPADVEVSSSVTTRQLHPHRSHRPPSTATTGTTPLLRSPTP
jgi:hypothetical protein